MILELRSTSVCSRTNSGAPGALQVGAVWLFETNAGVLQLGAVWLFETNPGALQLGDVWLFETNGSGLTPKCVSVKLVGRVK